MAITINGSGITSANIADGTITNADINASAGIVASKLGDLVGSLTYNGGTTLSNLKILTGSVTTSSSAGTANDVYGVSCREYIYTTISYSGFASAPQVFASLDSDYHETKVGHIRNVSTTSAALTVTCSRAAGITNRTLNYIIIGEAS
jgi:hypothetical protein